jgi:CheY-like chemotaxis protein
VAEPPLVLVVDDERPIRELLTVALREAGYRVATATDGREALARVAEGSPGLVITDVMMPVLGGAELCRRLRVMPETASLPIVLMSAVEGEGVPAADAFLKKPFDHDEVERLVARLIGLGGHGS